MVTILKLNVKHQQKNEIVTKCPKHINNKYMFYCLDCELHLCDLCKAEKAHQSHSIEPLKTDLDVSSIKKCINETKTRFTNYIINIKDNLIEILENPIRLVKKIAEDRVKKNTQNLEFYSNLVSSYESISNNFYLERNITNQKIFSTYNSYIDLSLFSYCETGKLLTKLKKISVLNQIENAYILSKRNKKQFLMTISLIF